MYAKELRDRYSQSCMLNENLIKEITKLKKLIKKYESS